MKTFFKTFFSVTILTFAFFGCSKSADATTTNTTVVDGFSWSVNGSSTKKSLVGYHNLQGAAINLFAVNPSTVFEINLTNKAPGTYNLGNGNGFYYNFSTTENLISPTSGSVTITSYTNSKATGTFSVSGNGTGVTAVSGTFTNIPL